MSNEKESIFSAKNLKYLTSPFSANNPVIVQILGICSALAVTVQMKPAIVMALSVAVVTGFSSMVMSCLRKGVPSRIRIIVQLVVIAALVILVDQILKAYVYEVSKQLSVYVGLIITNCIVMGRVEAFALGNKPWPAFLDGYRQRSGLRYDFGDRGLLPRTVRVRERCSATRSFPKAGTSPTAAAIPTTV